jgi:hypothetical protein
MLVIFVIAAGLGIPSASAKKEKPVSAEEAKHNYIKNYVFALAFEKACGSWRLDRLKAIVARSMFNLPDNAFDEGGPYREEFLSEASKVKTLISAMDGDLACDVAQAMYGPRGEVVPNWMTRR